MQEGKSFQGEPSLRWIPAETLVSILHSTLKVLAIVTEVLAIAKRVGPPILNADIVMSFL